jgi:hypothetical protein
MARYRYASKLCRIARRNDEAKILRGFMGFGGLAVRRELETARGLRGCGGDSLTCLLAAATGRRAAFAMLGTGMFGALLAAGPAS